MESGGGENRRRLTTGILHFARAWQRTANGVFFLKPGIRTDWGKNSRPPRGGESQKILRATGINGSSTKRRLKREDKKETGTRTRIS